MLEVLLVCICPNFRCCTLLCFTTLFSPILLQERGVSSGRGLGLGRVGVVTAAPELPGTGGITHLGGSQPARKAQGTFHQQICS